MIDKIAILLCIHFFPPSNFLILLNLFFMLTVHINKPLFTDIIFFIHILIGNIDIIHILSTDLCIENLLIGFSFYIIVGITNINKEDVQITIFIAYVIIMNFYFYKIILVNKI